MLMQIQNDNKICRSLPWDWSQVPMTMKTELIMYEIAFTYVNVDLLFSFAFFFLATNFNLNGTIFIDWPQ